jgi:hypothetical protein
MGKTLWIFFPCSIKIVSKYGANTHVNRMSLIARKTGFDGLMKGLPLLTYVTVFVMTA